MTEPPLSSLENRAIHGLFWSGIERLGPQAVQFIVSIVLARLLLPEQFGLIGMLTVFLALGAVFLNSGFGSALIQKQDATEVHYSSVFYTNILLSLVAAGVLCLVAPLIARFYGEPMLTPLTRVLSLNSVLSAFGLIQVFLMTKRLDFKTQTKVSLMASLGSGVVGVTMALLGFGVWSLVAQSVSATFFTTVFLWLLNTWRPQAAFSLTALRELFGFGSRLLASGLLDTVFRNLYNVVIGKLFSPADLGYYTRAYTLEQVPTQTLGGIVGRVTLPLFAEIQGDPARVRNGFRKALRTLVLVNFPLMIGLLACARPLVLTLLTEKWAPAIPYLQLLCIVGLLYPLHVINLNVLLAMGRSDLFFRLEVIKKVLIVSVLAVTWRWGIQAIIAGQIVVSIVAYYLNSYYSRTIVGYGITAQVRDLLPYLGAASAMGAGAFALTWLPVAQPGVLLLMQVLVGGLTYGLLCRGFRLPVFMDAWRLFQGKVGSLRMTRL
ncbi:MAG TPA: lipopolysaccharide biosynthesis protein [Anaerolineae bacterium]|nr:lipopolysaccharide biosynthesis protein [Anaerolineae bacterium]